MMMKQLILLFTVLLVPLLSNANTAQAGNEITQAFSKGNASAVAKFFDSSVDVTIMDKSDTYSKSQAEQVLKSFFSKNSVSGFKVLHNVDSKSGSSESMVGQLTAGGKSYRVYVLIASSDSSKIIQEISIKER